MPPSALLKQSLAKTYPVAAYGKGVFVYDAEGRDYLDGSSGAMTANIGHGVEEIAEAMRDQAARLAFTFRTQFSNAPAEALAARLAALAPGDLDWVFFVNSGSEASEYALRVALQYWRERGRPGKTKVLGREISYHGMTMGAVSMSGHGSRRADYGSLLHAFPVAPPAYAYRYGGEAGDDYGEAAARAFEAAILAEDVDTVAAVIAEPIVGAAGGVLVPPPGYFTRLREICDRVGVLLIMDEVITGLGRTGAWFASAQEGIVPDMILTGKGVSAGYTPMAAVLLREAVVEVMREGSGVAPFGHTFSGNPLSAATCLAVVDYIERHDLISNARGRGEELRRGLEALSQRYSSMVDVRGRGLMWGFEFVLDRASRAPPPAELNATAAFVQDCVDQGLIVYPAGVAPLNNAALIAPPLVITAAEVEELLRRLDRALAVMDARVATWAAKAA